MSTATVTKDNWGAMVLGGVATIIFGVAAVFWPGLTLLVLLYLFSAYALVSGVVNVMAGLGTIGRADAWFLPVALGAFELGVGIYLLRHVTVTFSLMVLLIGFTLIARGVVETVSAYFNSRASDKARTMSYVNGLAALVAGIAVLFAEPAHGVAFVWILGLYAIVVGTIQIAELSASNK
ncbi:MAG: DUF308 domain-containing protein [Patescibacteria group bacterium]